MKINNSRIAPALVFLYLGLFFLSSYYAACNSRDAFCGLPAIVITLPWSIILVPIYLLSGYITWYEKFAGTPLIYIAFAMLGLLPGALINAWIIHKFIKNFGRSSQ